jgi:hypothetical protein
MQQKFSGFCAHLIFGLQMLGFIYFSSFPWLKFVYAYLLIAMLTDSKLTPKISFFLPREWNPPSMSCLLENGNV